MNSDNQMPALLTEDSIEATWAKGNPKSIAARVTQAREEGYVNLTPFQRQFALEFVLSGTSLRKIARLMDLPQYAVQRMYNDPVTRAYIADLQKEVAAQRIINDQWIENQLLKNMPKLLGEEPVDIVTSKGTHVRKKKYHAPEIASLLKHFSSQEQKSGQAHGGNGVNVQINLGDLMTSKQAPTVIIDGIPPAFGATS